jgi:hypothetical protein
MAIDLLMWCKDGIGNKAELALQVASNTVSAQPFAGSFNHRTATALLRELAECLDWLLGYELSGCDEVSGVDGIASGYEPGRVNCSVGGEGWFRPPLRYTHAFTHGDSRRAERVPLFECR